MLQYLRKHCKYCNVLKVSANFEVVKWGHCSKWVGLSWSDLFQTISVDAFPLSLLILLNYSWTVVLCIIFQAAHVVTMAMVVVEEDLPVTMRVSCGCCVDHEIPVMLPLHNFFSLLAKIQ